jgi:hypothetical protein
MRSRTHWLVAMVFLAAAAVLTQGAAAQTVIPRGIDLFATHADGRTFVSFADDPLPADFFCPGSAPFKGAVKLVGIPLVTEPPGIAYDSDTAVERLSDVELVPGDVATVPIRMAALRLTSISPITVQCDWGEALFDAYVCLARDEEQPVTNIEIMETHDQGGFFTGDLIVVADVVFMDSRTGDVTEPIRQNIELRVLDGNQWMYQPGIGGVQVPYPFIVDTDCDNQPDRDVPGTTNFFPGWSPDTPDCFSMTPEDDGCHANPNGDHAHCPGTPCVEQG